MYNQCADLEANAEQSQKTFEPCKECDAQLYSTNICYIRACMNLCVHPDLVLATIPLEK